MDPRPTFPKMYHPVRPWMSRDFEGTAKYYTRTARPTRYYLIDFGLSRKYNPEDGEPKEIPIKGGDKTVPAFQGRGEFKPCNPFPTDIYYIGNLIRGDFLQVRIPFRVSIYVADNLLANERSRVHETAGRRHGSE